MTKKVDEIEDIEDISDTVDEMEATEEFIRQHLESDKPVLFLNSFKIMKEYPSFIVKLNVYLSDLISKELTTEELTQLIFASPRFLYEFLDAKKIFINIIGSEDKWVYSIEETKIIGDFKNRILAEHEAIMKAIAIVDKQN